MTFGRPASRRRTYASYPAAAESDEQGSSEKHSRFLLQVWYVLWSILLASWGFLYLFLANLPSFKAQLCRPEKNHRAEAPAGASEREQLDANLPSAALQDSATLSSRTHTTRSHIFVDKAVEVGSAV